MADKFGANSTGKGACNPSPNTGTLPVYGYLLPVGVESVYANSGPHSCRTGYNLEYEKYEDGQISPYKVPTLPDDYDGFPRANVICDHPGFVRERYGYSDQTFSALGTGDFSLEFWMRYYPHGGFGSTWETFQNTIYPLFGFERAASAPGGGVQLSGTNLRLRFFGSSALNVDVALSGLLDGSWQHVAATFDRDGLMVLYVNGANVGSTSIAAQAAYSFTGTRRWACNSNTIVGSLRNYDFWGWVSMWAFHRTVLTSAQIMDSVTGRRVQSLGAATTEQRIIVPEDLIWEGDEPAYYKGDPANEYFCGNLAWFVDYLDPVTSYLGHEAGRPPGWPHPTYLFYNPYMACFTGSPAGLGVPLTSNPDGIDAIPGYIRDSSGNSRHVCCVTNGASTWTLMTLDQTWDKT